MTQSMQRTSVCVVLMVTGVALAACDTSPAIVMYDTDLVAKRALVLHDEQGHALDIVNAFDVDGDVLVAGRRILGEDCESGISSSLLGPWPYHNCFDIVHGFVARVGRDDGEVKWQLASTGSKDASCSVEVMQVPDARGIRGDFGRGRNRERREIRGLRKFRDDRFDLRDRVGVSRIHITLDERVGKDAQAARPVIEGELCFRDEKQTLRQIEIVRWRRRDGWLEKPHHVVAKIPDRAADKPRLQHGRRGDQLVFRHQDFEFAQRISRRFKLPRLAPLRDADRPPAALKNQPR